MERLFGPCQDGFPFTRFLSHGYVVYHIASYSKSPRIRDATNRSHLEICFSSSDKNKNSLTWVHTKWPTIVTSRLVKDVEHRTWPGWTPEIPRSSARPRSLTPAPPYHFPVLILSLKPSACPCPLQRLGRASSLGPYDGSGWCQVDSHEYCDARLGLRITEARDSVAVQWLRRWLSGSLGCSCSSSSIIPSPSDFGSDQATAILMQYI